MHGCARVSLMANQLLLNAMPQIDILMLGWLAGTGEVGVYHAASRGALLITLVFGAMNAAAAPTIARLWGGGHLAELQKLVTSCARTTFSVAVLVGAAPLLGAKAFLGSARVRSRRARHGDSAGRVAGVVACGPT